MDDIAWLGRWEPLEAPGKHTKITPAEFARGYQYDPHSFRYEGVSRAIPVDGIIGASWANSPQARQWLEPERVPLWERFKAWLKK